VAEPTEV